MSSAIGTCPNMTLGVAGMLFTQLLTTLVNNECSLANPETFPPDVGSNFLPEYDFVLIGAGSAGNVIANRLTESGKFHVLLLEAGGGPSMTSEVPSLWSTLWKTDEVWRWKTQPDPKSCQGVRDGRCVWGGGRVLGGSSATNAMLYQRGLAHEYDGWGIKEWDYKHLLPLFKKSEQLKSKLSKQNENYHGTDGLLTVEYFGSSYSIIRKSIINGFTQLGYKEVEDLNGESSTGFSNSLATIRNGTRCSTAKSFLSPIKDRANIHLSKLSLVTKIIVDQETKRTMGVTFRKGGKTYTARASKEVIVSAGVVNTAKLLLLSGIGPQEHLQSVGVSPVVLNQPRVGADLQDHITFPGVFYSIEKALPKPSWQDDTFSYLDKFTGPLSNTGISNLVGFISTSSLKSQIPDLGYNFGYFPKSQPDILAGYLISKDYTADISSTLKSMNLKADLLMILPTLLNPKSRGVIRLADSDPRSDPLITTGYLTHPDDVKTLVEGCKIAAKLVETGALKAEGVKLQEIKFNNCPNVRFNSDEYWECAVRNLATTVNLAGGTCKMGKDDASVVDPALKVRNVFGLRLADASILPQLVSGSTVVEIMIGEMVSELVKKDWESSVGKKTC